jgi:hypothetical protein
MEAIHNNLNILAGSFARWLRCSVVTDPCGYAPPSRLASGQNSGAIIVQVIMNGLLSVIGGRSALGGGSDAEPPVVMLAGQRARLYRAHLRFCR